MPTRNGLSLIEVMIGITITLVILLVMTQFFQQMSKEIAKGRAIIDMASEGRSISELLRQDLSKVTVSPKTWTANSSPNGYTEIVEGLASDQSDPAGNSIVGLAGRSYHGDYDDILAMTIRSDDRPFRGRVRGFANDNAGRYDNRQDVETAETAEVIWWADYLRRDADPLTLGHDDQLNVYRRQLLIRPDVNLSTYPAANLADIYRFFAFNDISARWVDTNGDGARDRLVANSLADLAVRENRFAHFITAASNPVTNFPHILDRDYLIANFILDDYNTVAPNPAVAANLRGQDIALTGVAAFDVRVYSPNAGVSVNIDANQVVSPGDPGYNLLLPQQAEGAYVDLGFTGTGWFNNAAFQRPTIWPIDSRTWCSWWPGYESDGFDQDNNGTTDQSTDWLDSSSLNNLGNTVAPNGLVDDQAERETFPPFATPIRGIQVTIRMIEKNTGQIRQLQVESSFLPD